MSLRTRARRAVINTQRRMDTARAVLDFTATIDAMTDRIARYDSVSNSLTGLGTSGDKGTATRPTSPDMLGVGELRNLARGNTYAGLHVERLPKYSMRNGWTLRDESEEPGIADKVNKDLKVKDRFTRFAIESRKYGGAYMLMVYDDHDDNSKNPVTPASGQIRNLIIPDEREVSVYEYIGASSHPEYMTPKNIQYTPAVVANSDENDTLRARVVHHSRFIYMGAVKLSTLERISNPVKPGYDDSVLQRAWVPIRNKTQMDQVFPTIAMEMKQGVLTLEDLPDKQMSGTEFSEDQSGETMDLRMRILAKTKSLLNTILLMPGESYESNVSSVTGVEDLDSTARTTLSAAMQTPQTQLYGEPPAGLSTDGAAGRQFYDGNAEEFQEDVLGPALLDLYDACAECGMITVQGTMSIYWPPLAPQTPEERSRQRKTNAEADAIYISQGVLSPEDVQRSRFSGSEYGEEIVIDDADLDDEQVLEDYKAFQESRMDPYRSFEEVASPAAKKAAEDEEWTSTQKAAFVNGFNSAAIEHGEQESFQIAFEAARGAK